MTPQPITHLRHVDLAVPDDEVDATVAAQVTALAAGAPTALAETKRLLRSGTDLSGQFPALLELSAVGGTAVLELEPALVLVQVLALQPFQALLV